MKSIAGIHNPADDPRYTAVEIPPNVLLGLTLLADRDGVDCTPWFAGLPLDRSQIADPDARVSYRQAAIVLRRALLAVGDPALGMRAGRDGNLGSFGLLGLAMMTSASFGDAMRVGIENHKVCGSLLDIGFDMPGPREAALVAWPRFGEHALLPFLCEELFASCLAVARELVGPALRPLRLELTYPRPAYVRQYMDFFQCELRFGAPANQIVMDARWLEVPLPGYNARTRQQALAICTRELPHGTSSDEVVMAVEQLLRSRLREHPRLPEVARCLNMSERSLRRRLAEGGRVFRDIHDQLRAERAMELLYAGHLSVAEVGAEIGFADPREFRRAFKRWTGMPPRDARRAA
ncbi:AraC family transcriptional regulator [Pinirhizobacter sp.]|jgi:AraC-like DNA-binding protein|uniref:AraC family transcriptional regulator n=1 Tax=Pinirhizobacter sp. TaxID=2950432 RepID=UPI002F41294A